LSSRPPGIRQVVGKRRQLTRGKKKIKPNQGKRVTIKREDGRNHGFPTPSLRKREKNAFRGKLFDHYQEKKKPRWRTQPDGTLSQNDEQWGGRINSGTGKRKSPESREGQPIKGIAGAQKKGPKGEKSARFPTRGTNPLKRGGEKKGRGTERERQTSHHKGGTRKMHRWSRTAQNPATEKCSVDQKKGGGRVFGLADLGSGVGPLRRDKGHQIPSHEKKAA